MTDTFSALHIRDAREDEYAAIQQLTLDAYGEYAKVMPPSAWSMLRGGILNALNTTAPAVRLVAEQSNTLVGSVMLFPAAVNVYGSLAAQSAVPEVRLLAVAPGIRGQGIGRALVEACIARARQSGASEIGLHTSDTMQSAKQLYERMGFVRVPADDFFPNGAELVMAYRLRLASQ